MKENANLRILWLTLPAMFWMVGSNFGQAQQAPYSGDSGTYSSSGDGVSSAGASQGPGLYPSNGAFDTGAPELGAGTQMGLANSSSPDASSADARTKRAATTRSAWLAGSSSMGTASSIGWKPAAAGFSARGGTSWIAGRESFGIDRQEGGIWRPMPASGLTPETALQSSRLSSPASGTTNSGLFSTGLTPRGAAIVRGAGLSGSFASRTSALSGTRRSGAGTSGSGRGFGGKQSPFASHSGNFGGSASGTGSKPKHQGPSSGGLTGSSLNDTLDGNGSFEAPNNLDLGTGDSTSGSSH